MKYLQVLAMVFMVWELFRIIFLGPVYWKNIKATWFKNRESEIEGTLVRYPVLSWIGYLYVIFAILLIFSQWWWVGLSIFGLSIISALVTFPMIKNNEPFNIKIFLILLLDSLFTIFLLLQVINPITFFNG